MQTNNIKDLQDLCSASSSSIAVEAISTDNPKYSSSVEDLNNYELIYIIKGECTCEISHQPKPTISKGDCILLKVGSKIKLSIVGLLSDYRKKLRMIPPAITDAICPDTLTPMECISRKF
jgi:hypothetical protein